MNSLRIEKMRQFHGYFQLGKVILEIKRIFLIFVVVVGIHLELWSD